MNKPIGKPIDLAESVAGEEDPGASIDMGPGVGTQPKPAGGEVTCPRCKGTGQIDDTPCPACDGTGKVLAGT